MIHEPRIDSSSFYHFGIEMPRGMRHPVVNTARFDVATRKYGHKLGRRTVEPEDLRFAWSYCWTCAGLGKDTFPSSKALEWCPIYCSFMAAHSLDSEVLFAAEQSRCSATFAGCASLPQNFFFFLSCCLLVPQEKKGKKKKKKKEEGKKLWASPQCTLCRQQRVPGLKGTLWQGHGAEGK